MVNPTKAQRIVGCGERGECTSKRSRLWRWHAIGDINVGLSCDGASLMLCSRPRPLRGATAPRGTYPTMRCAFVGFTTAHRLRRKPAASAIPLFRIMHRESCIVHRASPILHCASLNFFVTLRRLFGSDSNPLKGSSHKVRPDARHHYPGLRKTCVYAPPPGRNIYTWKNLIACNHLKKC